jgi:polysaccharide biosynthesis transport protein
MNAGFRIPSTAEAVELARHGFDLRKYLNFAWRHWKFIGAVTAIALVIGFIYIARAIPLYTATTQVLLQLQPTKTPGTEAASDGPGDDVPVIENQLAILKSDPLLRRVVIKEGLAALPPSSAKVSSTPDQTEDPNSAEARIIQGAIDRLRGVLGVSRSGQAHVLNISVTWDDPVKAARLANAVADAYIIDQLDVRFDQAKRASAWLSDRLVELRQQLRESEEAVTKFRDAHGLVRTGPNVTLNEQQLADLNNKLIAARTEAAEKKARVDFLADVAAGKKALDSVPDLFQSAGQTSVIGGLRQKLADASQREADLLSRYNSRHPAVVTVEAEKRDIERSMAGETQRIAQAVKSDYALAKARQDAMERAMREATGQGGLDGEDAVRLRELERTAAVNKSLFDDFLQKAKISDEQSTFRARDARIILPARPPGSPSYPRTRYVMMLALFLGLGIGTGGAMAMEILHTGFTTPGEVEDLLGVPVLASIREMDKSQLKKDETIIPVPLYQLHHPLSAFSEALRTLRSGIHMSDVDHPPKIIQVTSARPGEGKTTVAISLAVSAAFSGLKVALVDADLRHPSTSRFFKLEKEQGLVDLLTGAADLDDVLVFRKDLRLVIIPAGSKSLNPPDVLGSERMKALMAYLQEGFDYVVVDTPPVGPVVDATIVARLADKIIFVVQWGTTPREVVESTVQQVSKAKRIGGIVLNFVKQERARKYGGEYYYDGSYEKYYSSE